MNLVPKTFPILTDAWTSYGIDEAVKRLLQEKNMLRETEAARLRIREEKESGIRPEPKADVTGTNRKAKRVLQLIVAIAAVVFLILGVCNGSAKAVHTKAANICTECVGLG